MNRKNVVFLIVGLFVGWITIPFLQADNEGNTYKAMLRKVISLMEQMQVLQQQTADNTRAIKEKLGAK